MGVSLAKAPYVRDARPSADTRAMIGAMLLHLQATRSPSALARSARMVAPALLAMLGWTRDHLESLAPIEWDADPAVRRAALDEALPVLITTLYSKDPCEQNDLARMVLDVVRPLRGELLNAHCRIWYQDSVALAFADRLWDEPPQGRLAAMGRFASYALTLVFALIAAAIAFPLIAAGLTDGPHLRLASDRPRRKEIAAPEIAPVPDLMAALGDMAVVTDVERARSQLQRHVALNPQDGDSAERVESHLADFTARIALAQRAGAMSPILRAESVAALKSLIEAMDEISSRMSVQAAQDLETGIRFIASAHGTRSLDLAPAGQLVAA